MPFEVFDKRRAPLSNTPSVAIQKRGLISINRAAYKLLHEPPMIELLFDRDEQVVGLRGASQDSIHGYAVRVPERESAPVAISGTAFTNYYGIDTEVSRQWTPELRDGILCIDLRGASTEIIGNRAKKDQDDIDGDDDDEVEPV